MAADLNHLQPTVDASGDVGEGGGDESHTEHHGVNVRGIAVGEEGGDVEELQTATRAECAVRRSPVYQPVGERPCAHEGGGRDGDRGQERAGARGGGWRLSVQSDVT